MDSSKASPVEQSQTAAVEDEDLKARTQQAAAEAKAAARQAARRAKHETKARAEQAKDDAAAEVA